MRLHRGKWDSWVSDTMTPILIRDGKVYLSLGPPLKDPTNYFWTVLRDLVAALVLASVGEFGTGSSG